METCDHICCANVEVSTHDHYLTADICVGCRRLAWAAKRSEATSRGR